MTAPTLLVLADADDPYIAKLAPLRAKARVVIGRDAAGLASAAADAEALLGWNMQRAEIEKILTLAPKLRWLHVRWAGLDSLLFPALVAHPLTLTNSRGVYSQSLGEFVILGALFFAKDVRRLLRAQGAHRWEPFTVQELRGSTMGIVGFGDIGKACASRAHALGMRVLAVRRRPERSSNEDGVEHTFAPEALCEMMRQCDCVAVTAPLTAQTRGLIGAREIGAMKSDAVLINVGRGPVIDETALIAALRARRIRGAALDVFSIEPLPPGHPLFELDNVLISPHCADNTPRWNDDAMELFLENFERFLRGEELRNVVDKEAGY